MKTAREWAADLMERLNLCSADVSPSETAEVVIGEAIAAAWEEVAVLAESWGATYPVYRLNPDGSRGSLHDSPKFANRIRMTAILKTEDGRAAVRDALVADGCPPPEAFKS